MSTAKNVRWVSALKTLNYAIEEVVSAKEIRACANHEHTKNTPQRVVESYGELFSGCFVDPKSVLKTAFSDDYSEMVYINDIQFVSMCMHHFLPFIGKAHFAYIPNKKIVGLSKIPRLIEVYARRPQVQEQLTRQITSEFQRVVQPKGCGLVMEAVHLCMCVRGVRQMTAFTRTSDLRGNFLRRKEVREEFLSGIPRTFKGF